MVQDTPLTLRWTERLRSRWRGEVPADLVMARILGTTAKDHKKWNERATQDLFEAALTAGAHPEHALEKAMTCGHVQAANVLIERGVAPTTAGLKHLAAGIKAWHKSNEPDAFTIEDIEEPWPWIENVHTLIERYPRHPGWIVPVSPGNPNRVIGEIGVHVPELNAFHAQQAGYSLDEQVEHIAQARSLVADMPFLVRGRAGNSGELVSGALQAALVSKALDAGAKADMTIKGAPLVQRAMETHAWDTVAVFEKIQGGLREHDLMEAVMYMAYETPNGEVELALHGQDKQIFMTLLGTHLPLDFDFDKTFEVNVEDAFDLGSSQEYHRTLKQLCGDEFAVVESLFRRRALMAHYGDIIEERDASERPPAMKM